MAHFNRLSPAKIATAQPKPLRPDGSNPPPKLYADGGCLYLQVSRGADRKTVNRSWVFRYEINGRVRAMGLGPMPDVTAARAREMARVCREKRRAGIDPIAERQAVKTATAVAALKTITFDEAASGYIQDNEGGWKGHGSIRQWRSSIAAHVSPIIGKLPVKDIDTALVLQVLRPLWKTKTETASRIRGRIERILGWAQTHGYREGAREADNPARWSGHLATILPTRSRVAAVRHHEAIPYRDVGAFMATLAQQQDTASRALAFIVLTAARKGEVESATWGEVDFAEKLWTVPAEHMKSGREHRVPLSTAAVDVLRAMAKNQGYEPTGLIFPGLNVQSIPRALHKIVGRGPTTHGFRSTFRDWTAELTAFPRELAEAALAHKVGGVEGAYQRRDLLKKRRRLMDAWAGYCAKPAVAVPEEVSKVVALQR
jgi:integrase